MFGEYIFNPHSSLEVLTLMLILYFINEATDA